VQPVQLKLEWVNHDEQHIYLLSPTMVLFSVMQVTEAQLIVTDINGKKHTLKK